MSFKNRTIVAALVGASMAGGAAGATIFGASASNAASTTTTAAPAPGPGDPAGVDGAGGPTGPGGPRLGPDGKFHSNENASHETTESAQREAQETAGQVPTVR